MMGEDQQSGTFVSAAAAAKAFSLALPALRYMEHAFSFAQSEPFRFSDHALFADWDTVRAVEWTAAHARVFTEGLRCIGDTLLGQWQPRSGVV